MIASVPESAERPAGLRERLMAFGVDAALLTALLFLVAVALSAAIGPAVSFPGAGGPGLVLHGQRIIVAAILNGLIGMAYFVGFWAGGGGQVPRATPGQRMLGIRVGRAASSQRLTVGQAAARWLCLMGPVSLGALLASLLPVLRPALGLATLARYVTLLVTTIRSPAKRGLHDRCAGSTVLGRSRGLPRAIGSLS